MPRPDRYLHGHHESVLRSHTWRTAENSAGYLLPHLTGADRMLDVGCGPGTITIDLAAHVDEILGIDSSPRIVEQARDLVSSGAEPTNCHFSVGDAYAIDAPDAHFDVVHAHQVLQHLSRPGDALVEWRRVLRPGGVLAVRDADYGRMRWTPSSPPLQAWNDLYRGVARGLGAEPDAGRFLADWVEAAGFTEVESSSESWVFHTPEERTWWGGLWADRVVASEFAAHARDLNLARIADLEGLATGWRDWIDQPDSSFECPNGQVIALRPA